MQLFFYLFNTQSHTDTHISSKITCISPAWAKRVRPPLRQLLPRLCPFSSCPWLLHLHWPPHTRGSRPHVSWDRRRWRCRYQTQGQVASEMHPPAGDVVSQLSPPGWVQFSAAWSTLQHNHLNYKTINAERERERLIQTSVKVEHSLSACLWKSAVISNHVSLPIIAMKFEASKNILDSNVNANFSKF